MGSSFSGNEFNAQLKKVLLFMTEHPDCKYLIHGKEGKNRTGYVTSVLLALSGATYEEISADYMASFENLYGLKKNRQQYELIAYAVPFMFMSMNGGKKINEKNLQQIVSAYLLNTVGLTNNQIVRQVFLIQPEAVLRLQVDHREELLLRHAAEGQIRGRIDEFRGLEKSRPGKP